MNMVKLEDLQIEWRRGGGLRKSDLTDDGSNYCVLYGELFTKHRNVSISPSMLSRTNTAGRVLSEVGDVLVPATSTASKKDMIIAREINDAGVMIGGDINIIRPLKGIFAPRYLAYFFETTRAYKQLERYITGTTGIIHLSNSGIKNLMIPLPDYEQQKIIVQNLDNAFEKINAATVLAEEKKNALIDLKASVLNYQILEHSEYK